MALLSGRQITRSVGGYTENFSWQVLWHHNRLPQCGLLWNWGNKQHGWVLTYTQNNARFGVPVAVTVKDYVFCCYVTPLQSGRYWPTFWRTPLPPLVEYKKNSWPRKDPGTWWQDTDLQVFGSIVSSSNSYLPVRSQSYVRTSNRYYILRYQTGRQRMKLNGSIPTTEHFKFNWPNGPSMCS
jgi:hypothetical protein